MLNMLVPECLQLFPFYSYNGSYGTTTKDKIGQCKKIKKEKKSHLRTFGALHLKYLSEESASAKTEY